MTGNVARHGDTETRRPREFASGVWFPHLHVPLSPRRRFAASGVSTASPGPRVAASRLRGFTLLELMIVITIVIILAAIALPQYQKTILHARESVLRDDLFKIRSLLDQYAADKGKLPQSLDDLISDRYMRELPVDPLTGQKDWAVVTGDDPISTSGSQGVTDVHSSSPDTSSEGTPYSEW
ncbi:MAG: type II secretion system protein [Acidobacteriota bacterium]